MSVQKYDRVDPEAYDRRYKEIPREDYSRQHWLPVITKSIEKYCKAKNVLDLGCGYGRYMRIIKSYAKSVTGIDVSEKWLNYARGKFRDVKFILGDAETILLENKFDTVVSIGLFEYVDRNKIMKQIDRFLNPRGYLIIFVPNKYSFARMPGRIYHRFFNRNDRPKEPSKKEILSLLSQNNFKIVESKIDDGLIWMPDILDKLFGTKIYLMIEKMFRVFNRNPFSNMMLFIAQKQD